MDSVEITTDRTRIDIDRVHQFLSESAYWALGRSRETVERSIANSICFSVFWDREQVGFARVVTDRAVFGYVMDVFILPPWRGRGLSKRLMAAIVEHPDLQGLRLYLRTSDAHDLYARFGFEPIDRPEDLMARTQEGIRRPTS